MREKNKDEKKGRKGERETVESITKFVEYLVFCI